MTDQSWSHIWMHTFEENLYIFILNSLKFIFCRVYMSIITMWKCLCADSKQEALSKPMMVITHKLLCYKQTALMLSIFIWEMLMPLDIIDILQVVIK